MANPSIFAAFERMWQHLVNKLGDQSTELRDYTDTRIADLVNSAPETLDTLGELATAMEENADVVEALDAAISTKANASTLTEHVNNATSHITSDERTAWNAAESNANTYTDEALATKATLTTITIPAGRMRGDVDGDGFITGDASNMADITTDIGLTYAHVMGTNTLTDSTQLECVDINNDGSVDGTDFNLVFNLATGTYKLGEVSGDITNTWTVNPNYETEEGQFYKDITVAGVTTTSDATIIVQDTTGNARFVKAECMAGAIRIYATAVPIAELTAFVSYVEGTGKAVISTAYPNDIVPISKGGTGATTVEAARVNLGAVSKTSLTLSLPAASWADNSITVTATGVTADNTIFVAPAPASQTDYTSAGVMCTAQAADSLTFTCTSAPSADLSVNIVILD